MKEAAIAFVNNFAQSYYTVEQYLNNNDGEMKYVVIGNGYFDSYLYIEGNSLKLKYKEDRRSLILWLLCNINFIPKQFKLIQTWHFLQFVI